MTAPDFSAAMGAVEALILSRADSALADVRAIARAAREQINRRTGQQMRRLREAAEGRRG